MTTLTGSRARSDGEALTIFAAALIGLALVYLAGFSPALHAVAHDSRHAVAFPCH